MINENLAPIILFVYNRPWHTQQTLDALTKNELAKESVLYIYADGAKENATEADLQKIDEVREIISTFEGCKEMHIIEREKNWGLANNVIDGVTKIVNQYGKIIVLEDDIVTSVGFLKYMNDALDLYQNEDKVMHVSAYMHKVKLKLPKTFFYNVNSCWGWGTWKNVWGKYENDTNILLEELLLTTYNELYFNGGQDNNFINQLYANQNGTLNTWAIKWHTSIYLNDGLCLHPHKSLIQNIGFDGSGIHCENRMESNGANSIDRVVVSRIKVNKNTHIELSKKIYLERNSIKNKYFLHIKNNIKQMLSRIIPYKLKHNYKLKRDVNYRIKFEKEQQRNNLLQMKRYQKGSSKYAGFEISFVDAPTFLYGYEEIFERNIYKFNITKPNPKIIDCGANIGLATIYFKKQYPNSHIIAFEPDPTIYNVLKQNISDLKFENVELHQKAIWTNNEGIEFNMEGGFSGRIPYDDKEINRLKVDTQRLKDILVEEVDFLKIDIEGAENQVIFDCKDQLYNVENIFIEYHSHESETQKLGEILSLLKEEGFRYHIQEAFVREQPFIERNTMLGMDLQLNIYGYRK